MAGSANPAMTQQVVPQMAQKGGGPVVSQGPINNVSAQVGAVPRVPTGGPQNMGPQPLNNSMANPYTQASQAQQAAMTRVGQGLNQTAAGGMAAYQNPYEQAVVDKTLRDVGGAAQLGLNQLGAQATQARAFGGSRHGIAEAEAMKGYQQQAMDKVAALRQQGFNTALGASQADMQRQLGAASQLAGMGQQSFGYGQAIQNQQQMQGAMQQQMMQNLINSAKQQFAGYAGAPQAGLSQLLGAVYGTQPMMGSNTTSQFNPGLFNYMQMAATASGGGK